jgi:hypothetical protein
VKSISDPFLRRPVLTLVIALLILLSGLISLPALQVENLPPIAPGRVTVRASYPGAGPEVVEQGVTALLEKQLNGLDRLDVCGRFGRPVSFDWLEPDGFDWLYYSRGEIDLAFVEGRFQDVLEAMVFFIRLGGNFDD